MNTPKIFFSICFTLILILLCVVFIPFFIDKENTNDISPDNHSTKADNIVEFEIKEDFNENPRNLVTQSNSNLIVNPTIKLDDLIMSFEEEVIRESEKELGFALSIKKIENSKKRGDTLWKSEEWMKDIDYYNSLSTSELAEECFSKPIFAYELGIFDDPRIGFERLRTFHNGFQVLFQRNDMWEGIIHTYEYLSSQLNKESDLKTNIRISGNLYALEKLYSFPEFKEQIKGREKIFLAANIKVLKQFSWYIENYDPIKLGNDTPGFFGEPCSVARVALILTKQVDPQRYNSIESKIKDVRWSKEQNIQDVKDFIELVLVSIEGVVLVE